MYTVAVAVSSVTSSPVGASLELVTVTFNLNFKKRLVMVHTKSAAETVENFRAPKSTRLQSCFVIKKS